MIRDKADYNSLINFNPRATYNITKILNSVPGK